MFARVAAAKSSSQNDTAKTVREAARVNQPENSARHPESAPAGISYLPKFSWNIGNVALHGPNDPSQPGSGRGGSFGATQHAWSLPWPMQAKLEVGAVDHPLEREADRVAEQVMRMPDAGAVGPPAVTGGRIPAVRRTCSCGGTCPKCRMKHSEEEHGEVRRTTAVPRISSTGSTSAGTQRTAPPVVHEVLQSPGEPLPAATRAFFEPRFAHDLSTIRVHTDDRAAGSAHAVRARAYTVGHNIVFGSQQYQPGTPDGRRLLAHELTHTIQQSAGSETGGLSGSSPVRSFSPARVMCAPPTDTPPVRIAHPSVMKDIQAKFAQFYAKLSPKARYRLNRNITIAIGVVTEESDKAANSPRWVFTLSGNASSKEIDQAADELGLTRWKPSARTQGRGSVGAPNDAEQLLTEGAETNHFDLWAVGVNRKVCADCQLHMKDAEVPVEAFPDTAFRKGGSLYQYQPPPAAAGEEGAADPPAGVAGSQTKPAAPEDTTTTPAQPKTQGGAKPPVKTGAGQVGEHEGGDIPTTPAQPKTQGGAKPPVKTGAGQVGEHEGGETPLPPGSTGPAPRVGGSSQMAIQVGSGIATVGLSWLASYLKARVDQKVAQRQIDTFLDIAKKKINANPDEAVKKMMISPEATVYAWVYLESAVITTYHADPSSLEPASSSSSPILDLSRIEYQLIPLDQSLIDTLPKISAGGLHGTVVHTIVIDIPLITPPLEDLISYAKAHKLALDDLRAYASGGHQAASTSLQTGLEARLSILRSYQSARKAYDELQADLKIAQKLNDVKLQKDIREKISSAAQSLVSITDKLEPVGEGIQKADQKLKYWDRILDLLK